MAIPSDQLGSFTPVVAHALSGGPGPARSLLSAQSRVTTAQIGSWAQRYGLDPKAVLAVASREGLGGGIGDSGTSFGPFQLHYGGAYPSFAPRGAAASQAWAWSPAGVHYALQQMQGVAKGLRGPAAINAIVSRFERPADIPGEISAVSTAYGAPVSAGAPATAGGSTVSAQGGPIAGTSAYVPPTATSQSQPQTNLAASSNPTTVTQDPTTANFKPDPRLTNALASLAAYKVGGTGAGLFKTAGQAATQLLSPQVKSLLAASAIGENNILQFNRGQQQLLSQLPSQLNDIYNPAIAMEQQIAQSTGNALAAANPNAADQAALQQGGAPPEQMAQLAQENAAGYGQGGAVLRALGNLPAFTLNEQKAAAQNYAANLPALSKIQAGQALSNYQSNQLVALGKILAQEPALAAKIASTLNTQRGQNITIRGQNIGLLKGSMPKVISSGGYLLSVDPITGQTTELHAPAAKTGTIPKVSEAASRSTGELTYVGTDGQLHAYTDAKGNPIPYVGTKSGKAGPSLHYYKDAKTGQTLAFDPTTAKTYQLPGGAKPPANVPVYQRIYHQGGYTYGQKPDGTIDRLPGARTPVAGGITQDAKLTAAKDFRKFVGTAGSPKSIAAHGPQFKWIVVKNPTTGVSKGRWINDPNYVPGQAGTVSNEYWEVINQGMNAYHLTQKQAMDIVNSTPGYDVEGVNGRPFTGANAVAHAKAGAQYAIQQGWSLKEALTNIAQARLIPKNVYTPIFTRAYSNIREPFPSLRYRPPKAG